MLKKDTSGRVGHRGKGRSRKTVVLWRSWDETMLGKGSWDPVCLMAENLNLK